MKTSASNHPVEQLDATPPARLTLHIYTIERQGLPSLTVVTAQRYDVARLMQGRMLIKRANGDCVYLAPDTVTRVDHKTREITLDAIN